MFLKLNMTGDTKAMRNEIITEKPLLRYIITKETIVTSTRLKLCSFMRRKRDKTSTTKKLEGRSNQEFDHKEAQMVICCV